MKNIFHIWNIFDTYNMSIELNKKNESTPEKISESEDKIKSEIDNNIKVSDNGNISVTALSF